MTNVIISTIGGANAINITNNNDADTFVVNGATMFNDKKIYDLRFASVQQIKAIDKSKAIDLGDESEGFLHALIEHVTGPARQRLEQFI